MAASAQIVQIKRLRDRTAFVGHLTQLGVADEVRLADDAQIAAALRQPITVAGTTLANRFAILPMEGWDATGDGRPTDLVRRRWSRFGSSGAALVWGGEAVAVTPDGRANPRQLAIGPHSTADLAELRALLTRDQYAGLQLTHSGRWSRPDGTPQPRTAYRHPLLDARVGADDTSLLSDLELDDLVGAYVAGAVLAREAGFEFVDIKHCHSYLLHELLSARERGGRYGGPDLASRLHFLDSVVAGIRRDAPGIEIGVRLSAFDVAPFIAGDDGVGVVDPSRPLPYPYAFGGDDTGTRIALGETHALCAHLEELAIPWLCITAGSPYYCPHIQRPAFFPPSDGYLPPRDPLHEVAQLLSVTRELARAHPSLNVVASGLSYLQEWLPAASASLVLDGGAAFVGYGRAALSYANLAADALAGRTLDRRLLCRTFSDCTTAPRHGMVSGCYPLDEFYKQRPERIEVAAVKRAAEAARGGRRRA